MKGKPIISEITLNLNKTRTLLEKWPDLIFAEENTYEIGNDIKLLKGIVRLGHLPTLNYMMIPLESLPLTKEFLTEASKAFYYHKIKSDQSID